MLPKNFSRPRTLTIGRAPSGVSAPGIANGSRMETASGASSPGIGASGRTRRPVDRAHIRTSLSRMRRSMRSWTSENTIVSTQ